MPALRCVRRGKGKRGQRLIGTMAAQFIPNIIVAADQMLGWCLWRAGFLAHVHTPLVVQVSPKSFAPKAASFVSRVSVSD